MHWINPFLFLIWFFISAKFFEYRIRKNSIHDTVEYNWKIISQNLRARTSFITDLWKSKKISASQTLLAKNSGKRWTLEYLQNFCFRYCGQDCTKTRTLHNITIPLHESLEISFYVHNCTYCVMCNSHHVVLNMIIHFHN